MVQNQGLDVYLAPFSDAARFDNIGKRYQEHAVPVNSPIFTGDSNEVWVQAMNGERFVVVVDLMEDFDAQSSKMLRIGVGIDDEETWTSRNYSELDCKTSDGANVEGRYSFQAVTRKVDGRWLRCGFTFVPLEMGMLSRTCTTEFQTFLLTQTLQTKRWKWTNPRSTKASLRMARLLSRSNVATARRTLLRIPHHCFGTVTTTQTPKSLRRQS